MKARRKALLLDQAGLAQRVGIALSTLQSLEQDRRRPSPDVIALLARHLELSAEEQAAFAGLALGEPPSPAPAATPTNLPAPLTSLVDRVRDVAALEDLIARPDVRLLSILGPPGIGKTRLSIAVAGRQMKRFPGGVWFVDLSVITQAERVLPAVARVLEVAEQTGRPLAPQIAVRLREAPALIVLDNFEQIVDGGATQVTDLLRACPLLSIIVTSRIALNVYGEFEYPAPALGIPPNTAQTPAELRAFESAQLFEARARQRMPAFAIDEQNAGHVADICIRLEGIALAIELAAARVRETPLAALAAALRRAPEAGSTWLNDLNSSARDLPMRQQRLVEAIRWSFDLLPADQQRLFARLSVFVGSFDTEAVLGVCAEIADPAAVGKALEALAAHSLIQRETTPGRWRLLEMIREFANGFARAHLALEGIDIARLRHAEYYANWAGRIADTLQTAEDRIVLAAYASDMDNLSAGLGWAVGRGLSSLACDLCAHLGYLWELRGDYVEGLRWIQATLALPASSADDAVRRSLLSSGVNLAWLQQQYDTALLMGEALLESARRDGALRDVCDGLQARARVELELDHAQDALATAKELLELASNVNAGHLTSANCLLGEAWLTLGDTARAVQFLDEAVRVASVRINQELWLGITCAWMAEVWIQRRDFVAARDWLGRWLRQIADRVNQTRLLATIVAGLLAIEPGHGLSALVTSARLWGAVDALSRRIGGAPLRLARQQAEPRVAAARRRMGNPAWEKAFREGAAWPPERIVAEVRGL
ncbi:MAG TPA: helix-turn-helix domain-containing protein, partial [Thermoflexales bacterium]|nr:helix-turn-helix domain-containing protein [Thermoflexales bacterium]